MIVELNGRPLELADGTTVAGLVAQAGASGADGADGSAGGSDPADRRGTTGETARGVAVAVDAQVVPRSEWESTELRDGQRVELLTAIQGG